MFFLLQTDKIFVLSVLDRGENYLQKPEEAN